MIAAMNTISVVSCCKEHPWMFSHFAVAVNDE